MEKNIEYYLNLPYTRELIPEPEGGWFIRVKELPGCMSQGDTPEEAMEMINEAMELWLQTALDHNMSIPEPRMDDDYSGKFVVRVPKSMHRKLVLKAEEDEISLNQWIVSALSESVGTAVHKSTLVKSDVPSTYPEWPGLDDASLHILQEVGFNIEAGKLDERCFSGWLEGNLAEIRHCVENSEYKRALSCFEPLKDILETHQDRSPVIRLLSNFVKDQMHLITKAQQLQQKILVEEKRTSLIRAISNVNAPVTSPSTYLETEIYNRKTASEAKFIIKHQSNFSYKTNEYPNE